ncbi:MAG: membrane protein insertion efficiency factor YidD [Oscillospiraceae bacterium]
MKHFLINVIKFYKKNLSIGSYGCCKYTPTCSQYAIDAIFKYGTIKGLYLSAKRFIKCNPFSKGGVDPVP